MKKPQPKKPKPRYERVEVWGNQCIRDVRQKRIIALCTEFSAAVTITNALNSQHKHNNQPPHK